MLKGIPKILSPQLLKIMMEMGHGDEIAIGDGNFPGQSVNENCVRCNDGQVGALCKYYPEKGRSNRVNLKQSCGTMKFQCAAALFFWY